MTDNKQMEINKMTDNKQIDLQSMPFSGFDCDMLWIGIIGASIFVLTLLDLSNFSIRVPYSWI